MWPAGSRRGKHGHLSGSREKNAQGCDSECWEKGWRAPLVILLPQVMPLGTRLDAQPWASGLAARYPVGHILGA